MGGQRIALIVASDEYEQEGLRNLLAPAADAEWRFAGSWPIRRSALSPYV